MNLRDREFMDLAHHLYVFNLIAIEHNYGIDVAEIKKLTDDLFTEEEVNEISKELTYYYICLYHYIIYTLASEPDKWRSNSNERVEDVFMDVSVKALEKAIVEAKNSNGINCEKFKQRYFEYMLRHELSAEKDIEQDFVECLIFSLIDEYQEITELSEAKYDSLLFIGMFVFGKLNEKKNSFLDEFGFYVD
jgi:hypothetical protein